MHNIIFSGELVAGYETEEVKANLAKLFKIDDAAKINAIFSGKAVTLKKNLDAEKAAKYEAVLGKAGALCRIEPPLQSFDDADDGLMTTSGAGVNFDTVAITPTQDLAGAAEPVAESEESYSAPYATPDAPIGDAENDSGTGKGAVLPEGARGLSWGGLFLTPIWGVFNGTFLALLSLLPYINLLVSIWMLIKGRQYAWQNKRWSSVEHFNSVQKKWSIAGVIIVPLAVLLIVGSVIYLVSMTNDLSQSSLDINDAEFEREIQQIDDPEMQEAMRNLRTLMEEAEKEGQYYDERDAQQE